MSFSLLKKFKHPTSLQRRQATLRTLKNDAEGILDDLERKQVAWEMLFDNTVTGLKNKDFINAIKNLQKTAMIKNINQIYKKSMVTVTVGNVKVTVR